MLERSGRYSAKIATQSLKNVWEIGIRRIMSDFPWRNKKVFSIYKGAPSRDLLVGFRRLDASLEFRAWEEQGGELQVGEGVAGGGALN